MAKTHLPPFELPPLKTLLGGISPRTFFRDYWQKRPLLVKNALPGVEKLLSPAQLRAYADDEDGESRLVQKKRGRWSLDYGPFDSDTLDSLPNKDWALLVQGVNLLDPAGDRLLNHFNFVPYARLDDLMVSLAPPGGGVGPHFDPYDVFLIQGIGNRRWEISTQTDRSLVPGAPLRILADFQVEETFLVEPGDLLYLPPQCAHNGVALTECMTLSVGFRSPSFEEMTVQYLNHRIDTVEAPGHYADPDLTPTQHPGEIPSAMLERIAKQVTRALDGSKGGLKASIARYLSEPKPSTFFTAPARPPTLAAFMQKATRHGVQLHPGSRLLWHKKQMFINGESLAPTPAERPALIALADQRSLSPEAIPDSALSRLHEWFCTGWLVYGQQK
jgi:50S ribosomal protein L16 3-hydroxylase